jgi:hypothetical protein
LLAAVISAGIERLKARKENLITFYTIEQHEME